MHSRVAYSRRPAEELHTPARASSRANTQSLVIAGALMVGCMVGAGVLITTNGNVLAAAGLVAAVLVTTISLYRLEWGFYAFVAIVLALDQFQIPGLDPLTYRINYFTNMNAIQYVTLPMFLVVTPMEVHLLALILIWLVWFKAKGETHFQPVPLWGALGLFLVWLLVALLQGIRSGGEFVVALWELRALFYCFALYILVPQFIHTTEHIRGLMWTVIGALAFKAFLGAYRFAAVGFSMSGYDALLTNEDPLLIATLLLFLMALVLFNVETRQKTALWLLAIPLLVGFYSGNRRAAYAALAAALGGFLLLLPKRENLRFWLICIPLSLVFIAYVVVFWESDSPLGSPLRQIRSGFDEQNISERNYYSNLYRKIEEYNLAVTLQHSPVAGIGFGTKYDQPMALARIEYSLRDYMAHNNVLWLLVKTGAVGFFLFWVFLNTFATRAAGIIGRLGDPYLQVVAVLIVVVVINQIVGAYYDLHLVRYRPMIYMGMMMGLLPVLVRADSHHVPVERARAS